MAAVNKRRLNGRNYFVKVIAVITLLLSASFRCGARNFLTSGYRGGFFRPAFRAQRGARGPVEICLGKEGTVNFSRGSGDRFYLTQFIRDARHERRGEEFSNCKREDRVSNGNSRCAP